MENLQIGFSDEFTYGDNSIRYIITNDNKLELFVEDCAIALGVTKTSELKNGKISITVRWDRVYDDLIGIGLYNNKGLYKYMSNKEKKNIRKELNQTYITINNLLLWSKKTNTYKSNKFIQFVNNLNINNLNNDIVYTTPERREIEFIYKLEESLKPFNIEGKSNT